MRKIETTSAWSASDYVLGCAAGAVSALTRTGSCHLFRHTMATLMLEGGADIRHVQQMLGHSNIASTQIYTRVSLRALEAVHSATHPGAVSEPRGGGKENDPGRLAGNPAPD